MQTTYFHVLTVQAVCVHWSMDRKPFNGRPFRVFVGVVLHSKADISNQTSKELVKIKINVINSMLNIFLQVCSARWANPAALHRRNTGSVRAFDH